MGKFPSTLPTAQTWPLTDFHLFGPLKNAQRGRRFAADDEVKEAVHDWLRIQPQTFFSNGIKSLQISGLNVPRRREIILKSNVVLMSVT